MGLMNTIAGLAAAVLVEDQPRPVPLRVPGAVNAVARAVAIGVGLTKRHGALVIVVCSVKVVIDAGQVTQHQEALALGAPIGRRRIVPIAGRESQARFELGDRLSDGVPRPC